MRNVPIGWLQLRREKLRLAVALLGVSFAVVLIFVQLGFEAALYDSSVRYHTTLGYELAMISPKTDFIVKPTPFPRSRLHQARGFPGVAAVSPVYLGQSLWRNPLAPDQTHGIFVVGFDPSDRVFDLPGVRANLELLKLPDRVLFDRDSRPEYGPVAQLVTEHGQVETEVSHRRVLVGGLFRLGTSFGVDGSLIASDLTFRRIFPERSPGQVDLGLIHLEEDAEAGAVAEVIEAAIPADVAVLTREDFIEREIEYWSRNTPIGYLFGFGVAVGLLVGAIVVYQILFDDVQDHLEEYATLKAIGYTNSMLSWVVIQQAVILASLGFLPGFGLSMAFYATAGEATRLPLAMTTERALLVFGLTLAMCCFSSLVALRKIRTLDPAQVF